MSVYGTKQQARALAAQSADQDRNRWLVGTFSLEDENHIHLIDYDEDMDIITSNIYTHPEEIKSIAPSLTKSDCFLTVPGGVSKGKFTLWELEHMQTNTDKQFVNRPGSLTDLSTIDTSQNISNLLEYG